ncbi:MAG TPA: GFA family protein [Steroidobacteraceae bacterium]
MRGIDVTKTDRMHTGGCLCGAVRYRVRGALRGVIACHCAQCRRTSGHFAAMSSAPSAAIELTSSAELRWYRSSDTAERGFCGRCGGNLFWRQNGSPTTSITAGSLDTPTQLAIEQHIFVADKSDYYSITDGLPQKLHWD